RGELVPQLGHPQVPHLDLGELRTVLAFREHDGVDQPYSPCRTVTEVSRRFCGVRKSVSSSRNRGGLVFPMRTSPPFTNTSGEMSPSSGVRFAYERSARAPRTSGEGISKWSSWPPGYR